MCSKEPDTPPPPPPPTVVRDDGCICPAEPPKKSTCGDKLSTCPYDPRFPDMNQTKHCYTSFIDYQRSLCPVAWTERWYEQMEKGTFPRNIYPPKPIIRPSEEDICSEIEEEPPPPPPPCP